VPLEPPSRSAALALSIFVVALCAEHALEPDLSPTDHMISEYANSGTGTVMEVGFAAWCMSWILMALIFARRRWWLGTAAAVLAALGVAVVTAFRTQAVAGDVPADVRFTLGGRLHDLGGDLVLGGVAVLALTMAARRGANARLRAARMALVVAALGIAGVLLALGDSVPRLRQRVLVAATVGWQALVLIESRSRYSLRRL
jgi:hypothetical protein